MITAHRVCFPTEHRTMHQDDSHTGDGDSQRACIAISIALLCWSPSCVVSIHAVRACCFRCCAIIFFGGLCCSIPIVPVLFGVSFRSVCSSHSATFCGVPFIEFLCCSVMWVSVLLCYLSVCVVLFCEFLVLWREFQCFCVLWVSVLFSSVSCCVVLWCEFQCCCVLRVSVLFCSASCCVVLWCEFQCCCVLWVSVLFCSVSFCVVLWCEFQSCLLSECLCSIPSSCVVPFCQFLVLFYLFVHFITSCAVWYVNSARS
jgi:hypothetical protein